MMADERVAGTLFIDMKYVFLYHKLGFREHSKDCYCKQYRSTTIEIESEKQYFVFNEMYYPLTNHKDFVILELTDILLEKGYQPSNLVLRDSGLSLLGPVPIDFVCAAWGKEYLKLVESTKVREGQAFYTSQLSGGLIDREYLYNSGKEINHYGLFENEDLYDFRPIDETQINYPEEYLTKGNTLVSYKGVEPEVCIPPGITKIESGSFWNNRSVRTIAIPDTVIVIGGDAFAYCDNLESVNIPESVKDIGDDPFAGCPNLIINNNSPNFVLDNGVLFTSDRTRLIHYTPCLISERYTIPDSVEWVGKHSFYNCNNLKEVTIGPKVDYMGNNPFSDCHHLVLINNSPNFIYRDGALLDREECSIIHYSHGRDADEYVMPDTVRIIGRNSFWNCKRIRKITLGKDLRQIGYNPFANCSNLTIESNSPRYVVRDSILFDKDLREVICCSDPRAKEPVFLPNSVENIGRNAFAGCVSLHNIMLPESIKTISRGAFSHCESITHIHVPDSVELIEKWAFSYCYSLLEISISGKTKIAKETFAGSNQVKVMIR